jgi:hypothetical protein
MLSPKPDAETLPLPVSHVLRRTPEIENSSLSPSPLPVLHLQRGFEALPLPFRGENSGMAGSATSSTLTLVDVSQRTAPRASCAARLREWVSEKIHRFAAFAGIARARTDVADAKDDLAGLTKELEAAKRSARISEQQLQDTTQKLQIERDANDKLLAKVASLRNLMGKDLEWDDVGGIDSGRASSKELSSRSSLEEMLAAFQAGTPRIPDMPLIVLPTIKPSRV